MKQILVISGKGGTGKTVITGALAAMAPNKVLADCDVDAADLHLLLDPAIKKRNVFRSGKTAFIDNTKCTRCGACREACRFDAISRDFLVDPISCEGCGFCRYVCPEEAVEMRENVSGKWFVSETRFGPMVHARLGVAEENSGKLVSLVRREAQELAQREGRDWVIIDGPPGIGCPVIASLSGVDLALVVTEPTRSGLHDAERVIGVARHFNVPVMMVINKFDLNVDMTGQIEDFCERQDIRVAGRVGFHESVVRAMVEGRTIMEYPGEAAQQELRRVWKIIENSEVDP